MIPPKEIAELIERFERNREAYLSGDYNETQLRREFIDPFFAALGWDVENKSGYGERYKDVIHEDAIKIGGATKAPDYCFRIGGARKFFVEAKKPSVNLKDEVSPAFQLRRYAWSAKLPLSILTNFSEFAVYDCREKPSQSDRPAVGRTLYLRYTDYEKQWEEIGNIFSKEAVLKGSFDKYAETNKARRGTAEVDEAFLQEIENWRDWLARNMALRNTLSQPELNFAVQRTIDRLIFLRICEDRGIETYGALMALLNGEGVYKRLREIFHRADERYNSDIFHFQKEKSRRETPDELTLDLQIDDKPLKEIIRNLYYPDSPYEFSVLPADILGQVYEQFLGKVIRLTSGGRAVVEDKPEVKKAGGVYYTPTHIVDYIFKNTVGKLLEGKTPKQAAKLRLLDPACGSGSFLIGAYQYLLDWHRDWYVNDGPEKHAASRQPALYQAAKSDWRLTTTERKRILLNNIYGVDIDPQAVEVTKLSLLLKVLEGENAQTISQQLRFFHERALPDLGNNIKCGNSLIGPDFYQQPQMSLLDDEERLRINVFDWRAEFPEIMKAGGFDAVIGNPPYIRIQMMKEWAPVEVEVYKQIYTAAGSGNYDIYVVFVEKGLRLLNKSGRLGFILPHKFFNAKYGEALRSLIAKGRHLKHVVHFGDQQVFAGATTYTCLLFLEKAGSDKCRFVKVDDLAAWQTDGRSIEGAVSAAKVTSTGWNFIIGREAALFARLKQMPKKLVDFAERMAQGIRTSANEVYVLDLISEKGKFITARSESLNKEVTLERESVRLFLQGREIKRYRLLPSGKIVVIPYRMENRRIKFIDPAEFRNSFPKTFAYLSENKTLLENRERGRMHGSNWYAYVYPKNIDLMRLSKILVPDIAERASFALDEKGEYAFTSGYGIVFQQKVAESPKYFLGLLNSKVLHLYLMNVTTPLQNGFFRYFTQYLEQLPIRPINFSDPADKSRHDRMVKLVERMLALLKQLAAAKIEHEKTALQRQIEATDRQIDALVYELYGLTAEEIKIVEGADAESAI